MAAGVPVHMIPEMDDVELAYSIRGYEIRQTNLNYFLRWMTAALLQPHAKKGASINPKDLISLGNESKSAKNSRKNRLDLLKKVNAEQKNQKTE